MALAGAKLHFIGALSVAPGKLSKRVADNGGTSSMRLGPHVTHVVVGTGLGALPKLSGTTVAVAESWLEAVLAAGSWHTVAAEAHPAPGAPKPVSSAPAAAASSSRAAPPERGDAPPGRAAAPKAAPTEAGSAPATRGAPAEAAPAAPQRGAREAPAEADAAPVARGGAAAPATRGEPSEVVADAPQPSAREAPAPAAAPAASASGGRGAPAEEPIELVAPAEMVRGEAPGKREASPSTENGEAKRARGADLRTSLHTASDAEVTAGASEAQLKALAARLSALGAHVTSLITSTSDTSAEIPGGMSFRG